MKKLFRMTPTEIIQEVYDRVPNRFQIIIDDGHVRVLGAFDTSAALHGDPNILVRIVYHECGERAIRYLAIGQYRVPGGWTYVVHEIYRPNWYYFMPDAYPGQFRAGVGERCKRRAQNKVNKRMEIVRYGKYVRT